MKDEPLFGELRRIRGTVKADLVTRNLYSTDASSYRVLPMGVVFPEDDADVVEIVRIVARHGASIVPRGGGTSLSGQTIGPGVVVDNSRHLNGILELNREAGWVRVQAGMVLDSLNRALLPLMVGPDPASSMTATLGGMTGNNSTGSHSIVYGMMADHVKEVEVVLADGSQVRFGPKSPEELALLQTQDTLEGRLYREIPPLVEQVKDEIAACYPKTWRNVAGYNLNRILLQLQRGESLNLAPLMVGSEGTLGLITSIKLGLVKRPAHAQLLVIQFESLYEALALVPYILEFRPSAVELIDQYFNHLTRQIPEYNRRLTFIEGNPRAVLVVEFAGDDETELTAQREKLADVLRKQVMTACTTPEAVANVWAVRKAGLGILMSKRGDAKPLAFVDDAAVPVENLADYALEFEKICRDAGTEAAFYAHASAGCLHINPLINLKTQQGIDQMRQISQGVAALAIRYGGTTTGEHGEGFARSYFNQQLYGERLHQAFRQVKGLFDPNNIFNPGKIVDAPEPWAPEFLRFNVSYQTPYTITSPYLDFARDGGFAGLVEMCNGQGVCRKTETGVMCPSYMATRDEAHSTRGRANTLRAAMSGQLGVEGLLSREVYEVLDLCLECKACQRECPSLVDMAKLKYEFLAHYHAAHGTPLRSRLFGNIALWNAIGSRVPSLTNWAFRSPILRAVLDSWLKIDRRRALPPLAKQTFRTWFARHPRKTSLKKVVLWDDTFLLYNEPEIGQAAVRLLETAGYEVLIVQDRRCCGRPLISKGLLKQARANAAHNVNLLYPYVQQGIPIVGVEPSCVTALKDEYPDFLRNEEARAVAANTFFIEEVLSRAEIPFAAPPAPQKILVHGHCHQKAAIGTQAMMSLLGRLPDTIVEEIPSGCCGMAGAFGYEKEHYDLSLACGEDRLFPAIRAAEVSVIIAAPGTSCRHQIADGTARRAVHPVQVLAEHL